jgi:hypothetical protein
MAGAQSAIDAGTPGLAAEADAAGAETATGFESGADFEAGVRRKIQLGKAGFDITAAVLVPAAILAGRQVGKAFDDGIALGIITNSAVVRAAARNVVRQAESAAKSEAGIASPSRLFADAVGDPIAAGIALGIGQGASQVGAAAAAVVSAGAVQAGGAVAVAPAAGAVGGGVSIARLDVQVNVEGSMTAEQARTAGAAVADGIEARLEERRIQVDVRTL